MTHSFALWLIDFMAEREVTQETLGKLIGVSHVAVSKWQRSLNLPEPKQLRHLAEAAGLNPVELLQLCGYLPFKLPKPLKSSQRTQMLYALHLLEDMDDATLDLVADQVRVFKAHAKRRRPAA